MGRDSEKDYERGSPMSGLLVFYDELYFVSSLSRTLLFTVLVQELCVQVQP